MPNCSIEAKQKVVSLYHKEYSLFSISKATSVPKSTCWDIVRRYNSRGHVKNRKTINSIKYLQILQKNLLPEMFLGEKLQQDNAPAHNSILSKTWFSENGLEILENWPPNSPDINIIENV